MMNRKNGKGSILHRLLCLMLALAMVLCLAACDPQPTTGPNSMETPGNTTPSTSTQATQPTTQPTTPPTTVAPTIPETVPPTEPPVDPSVYELVYTLTQEDVDEFYRLLSECEALSLAGEDMDAIDAAVIALDESYEYLNAQYSIATIFHYERTGNQELEQRYLDCVEICTDANDAYLQMARRVYQSDSPAKDSLFEGWTQEEIDSLLAYDEDIAKLQQRNAEIGVEYRAAKDDAVKMDLYIEFVKNNNKIAKYYGYDNYYTYSYERVYERDYGMKELEQMRQYAKTYLTDIHYTALNNFYKSFYSDLSYNSQLDVQNFLYADYNSLKKDYVGLYIDAAPETLKDALTAMLDHDSLFAKYVDTRAGAFTTTIGDRSYCFFGPGYWGCNTVIHEGGHYYASLYTDLGGIPLDLAEVHSQANEWLFISFIKDKMASSVHKAVVDYMLYDDITMTLICLMVDEFEQRVYSTDLKGFTAEDFNAIMNDVAKQYYPNGDVSTMLTDINAYWRQVVVDQPIYYISYAVSGIAAVSLYTVAESDYGKAMAIYQQLCEEPVLDAGFLGNIQAAGLYTPFDEQFYLDLQALVNGR